MAMRLGLAMGLPTAPAKGGGYTAEAVALFARFTTPPSAARKASINRVFVAGKRDGWLASVDALKLFAAADAQAGQRNWIADLYNSVVNGSPTFLADRYYAGDGSAAFLETNFNPTTASTPKFTQNSATVFLWSLTNLANGGSAATEFGNSNTRLGRFTTSAQAFGRPNTSATINALATGAFPGLVAWTRSAAGVWRAYVNGVDVGGGTDASAALTNATFQELKANAVAFGVNQIAAIGWGASLTADQHLSLYRALANYLWEVGAIAGGPF